MAMSSCRSEDNSDRYARGERDLAFFICAFTRVLLGGPSATSVSARRPFRVPCGNTHLRSSIGCMSGVP